MAGRPPLHPSKHAQPPTSEKQGNAWEKLQSICGCVGKHAWHKQGNAICPMLEHGKNWCVQQLGDVLFSLAKELPHASASPTYRRQWMLHLGNLPVFEAFLTNGHISALNFTTKLIVHGVSPVWWLHHLHVAVSLLPYHAA